VSSLSTSTIGARAWRSPTLTAAQNPDCFSNRTARTPGNDPAVREALPAGESSSTTSSSQPGGACLVTLARQRRSRSARL
jgi:hypothetical protein